MVKLPHALSRLSTLRYLDLIECDSKDVLNSIVNLSQLSYLSFNCKSVPQNIGNLHPLQSLSLRGDVHSLPDSFAKLTNLMLLSFCLHVNNNLYHSYTRFVLPVFLGNLSKLTALNLTGYSFDQTLPENLGMLTELSVLNLSNCLNIDTLPESKRNRKTEFVLVLRSCFITTLKDRTTKTTYISRREWRRNETSFP